MRGEILRERERVQRESNGVGFHKRWREREDDGGDYKLFCRNVCVFLIFSACFDTVVVNLYYEINKIRGKLLE